MCGGVGGERGGGWGGEGASSALATWHAQLSQYWGSSARPTWVAIAIAFCTIRYCPGAASRGGLRGRHVPKLATSRGV